MTDQIDALSNSLSSLGTASEQDRGEKRTNNAELGQQEFLTLLVEQLKSQDPMNPMQNEEFAVQLAQFSQLEQLISLNESLGSNNASSMSGLAGFLGQQVTLPGGNISLKDGAGPSIKVTAPNDTVSTSLQLLDSEGQVVFSEDVGQLPRGEHTLNFKGINVADGEYSYRLVGTFSNGREGELSARTVGTVEGFIPGPDPVLIVDGQEVSLSEVTRVDYRPPAYPEVGSPLPETDAEGNGERSEGGGIEDILNGLL